MPLSNLSRVEKEHQNGPATPPRNEPQAINIITQGSIRHRNVAELHNLPKRNGICWAEFIFQIFITLTSLAIFILPGTFKNVGYLPGVLGFFGVAFVYAYMMWILLWCDEYMQKKRRIEQQSLFSMVDHVFEEYKCPRVGRCLNFYLKYEIILSWTMGLSFGLFFINKNVQLILAYFDYETTDQVVLLGLAIPTMLICWFPHIQSIACFSYFITLIVTVVICEVVYYIVINPMENPRVVMINDLSALPNFLFTVFYVLIFTPLIFPLKLEMKHPSNLMKLFGGVNLSILLVITLNTFFSLLVYFKLGDDVQDNIVANLPKNRVILITYCLFVVSSLGGGALSFFMIFQILWYDGWENYFKKSSCIKFYEYVIRSMLGLFIILLAMVVPTFSLFVNLISSFSYLYDSVLLPLILQSVIVWNDKQNTTATVLILIKNITLGVLCVLACAIAFYESLTEILSYYRI